LELRRALQRQAVATVRPGAWRIERPGHQPAGFARRDHLDAGLVVSPHKAVRSAQEPNAPRSARCVSNHSRRRLPTSNGAPGRSPPRSHPPEHEPGL
jgi:hypothetical protein